MYNNYSIPALQHHLSSSELILNGEIIYENLKKAGLGEGWLLYELKKKQISSPATVLKAWTDNEGALQLETKS